MPYRTILTGVFFRPSSLLFVKHRTLSQTSPQPLIRQPMYLRENPPRSALRHQQPFAESSPRSSACETLLAEAAILQLFPAIEVRPRCRNAELDDWECERLSNYRFQLLLVSRKPRKHGNYIKMKNLDDFTVTPS